MIRVPIVRRSRTSTNDYGATVLLWLGSDWQYMCLLPRPVVEQVSFVPSEHLCGLGSTVSGVLRCTEDAWRRLVPRHPIVVVRYIKMARAQPRRCQSLSVANPGSAPLQLVEPRAFASCFRLSCLTQGLEASPTTAQRQTPRAYSQAFRLVQRALVIEHRPKYLFLTIQRHRIPTSRSPNRQSKSKSPINPQPRTRKHLALNPLPAFFLPSRNIAIWRTLFRQKSSFARKSSFLAKHIPLASSILSGA